MLELIDTHAHLGDKGFAGDREAVLDRALKAGVTRVVEIADSPAEWDAALALARSRPGQVRCSLGLHPYHADQFSQELLEALGRHVGRPEVAAVGEIGLDYVKTELPKELQIRALESLFRACRDWGKPVVVHCRGAYEDLVPILRRAFPEPPANRRYWGVVHCFSGTAADALACSGLGFALGVDGPVTYPKNDALRAAFRSAGPGALVLETDSPYLPPQSSRGKRNEPAAVAEIAAKLAEVLGLPLDETARVTTANAKDLFGL